MLVEIGAQPLQFFGLAQSFGRDGLVELPGESLIIRRPHFGPRFRRRTVRIGSLITFAKIAFFFGLELARGGIDRIGLGFAVGFSGFGCLRLGAVGALVALAFEGFVIVAARLLIVALLGFLIVGVGAEIPRPYRARTKRAGPNTRRYAGPRSRQKAGQGRAPRAVR